MTAPGRAQGELTIGVVGPHELVERIMLSGTPASGRSGGSAGPLAGEAVPPRRLVAAAYRDEQEAADQVVRLGAAIDVCLFASRVPYEYARAAGVLATVGSGEPDTDLATRRCSIAAPGGAGLLPVVVRALDEAAVPVEDIALRRPTLDEVFLALTGRSAEAPDPTTPKENAA